MANELVLTLGRYLEQKEKVSIRVDGASTETEGNYKYKVADKMTLQFAKQATDNSAFKINKTSCSIKVSPVSIEIKRNMGKHNTIDAVVDVNVKGCKDDNQTLILGELKNYFLNLTANLSVKDGTTLKCEQASYYHIVKVSPEYVSYKNEEQTYRMTMRMASWDTFMDMTQYSRAYTSRKLADDIAQEMTDAFKNKLWKLEKSNMRILRRKVAGTTPTELILPYLVQYNETDYTFLLRNASRYGEFLYFENGKLNIGLHNTTTAANITTKYIKAISSQDNPYDNDMFYHDALTNSGTTAPDKPYLAEYSNSDYFDTIKRTDYDNTGGWMGLYPDQWSRWIAPVLQMDVLDLPTVVGIALDAEARPRGTAKTFSDSSNKTYNNTYFVENNIKNKTSQYSNYETGKEGNSKIHSQFTDYYTDTTQESTDQKSKAGDYKAEWKPNTKLIFEKLKASYKASLQQYVITVNSALITNKLGDEVTLNGDTSKKYVIIGIESSSSYSNKVLTQSSKLTLIESSAIPLPLPATKDFVRTARAQTAIVTASDDPKRLGRVRVRYHWQKDDKHATPWIRVAVPFSTKARKDNADDSGDAGAGMFCLLERGDEVMVDYENGNVERPYVVGSVYSGSRTVPFGGRNYTTVYRSRYGHTIGIREPSGTAGIFSSIFPGLKMFNWIPGFGTAFPTLDSPSKRRMAGGFDITDAQGFYSISTSSDARKISIGSPFGTVDIDAAMGITISAPNGNVKIVGKNVDIIAGNNITLKSGENIDTALISNLPAFREGDSKKRKALAGKGSWNRFLKNTAETINGAFDIPALRFAMELVFRPVSGTLKIHSGRYLLLETADGSATTPKEDLYWGKYRDRFWSEPVSLKDIFGNINTCCVSFQNYVASYTKEYGAIRDLRTNAKAEIFKVKGFNQEKNPDSKINDYIKRTTLVTVDELKKDLFNDEAEHEALNNYIVKYLEPVRSKVVAFLGEWNGVDGKIVKNKDIESVQAYLNREEGFHKDFICTGDNFDFLIKGGTDGFKAAIRKKAIEYLSDGKKHNYIINLDGFADADYADNGKWQKFIMDRIIYDTKNLKPSGAANIAGNFAASATSRILSGFDVGRNSIGWKPGNRGKILLSQQSGSTLYLNNGVWKFFNDPLKEIRDILRTL